MFRKISFLCVILALAVSAVINAATYPGQLGVNLGGTSEAGGMFVDMAKEHHRWSRLPEGTMKFDKGGWPASDARLIMDFRLVAEWAGTIDDPEQYRYDNTGTYKCSFSGQANIKAKGATVENQSFDSKTNKTTFDLKITKKRVYCQLDFTNTKRDEKSTENTGISNLKMNKPGYPADTKQLFTDDFLNCLESANFGVVRYMNTTNTNHNDAKYPATMSWSERKLMTDSSQVSMKDFGKMQGAAWEYVIELANMTKIDPWINVPVSADKNYIRELAEQFRDNLDKELNLYVENSNEVWNGMFFQQQYNKAQAKELGINEHENYARRAVEIAKIFEEVFGEGSLNKRVRIVLCSHSPMLKWWVENYMVKYMVNTMGITPKDYIWGIARQTYFGCGDPDPDSRSIDELIDACLEDVNAQIDIPSGGQSGRKQWIEKAASWGFVGGANSYEGGFHSPAGGKRVNLDNKIQMHRVDRAKDVLKYNYDDGFFALGGNIAMHFTLQSSYARHGCWGLTDDLSNPDRNHKFQACRELLRKDKGQIALTEEDD
ncbi:MAG: hypothetical protein K940chlam7_00534 [Chlamydiae bacterium]|nr:hypothetical protein [Chlamydiota bacterium]